MYVFILFLPPFNTFFNFTVCGNTIIRNTSKNVEKIEYIRDNPLNFTFFIEYIDYVLVFFVLYMVKVLQREYLIYYSLYLTFFLIFINLDHLFNLIDWYINFLIVHPYLPLVVSLNNGKKINNHLENLIKIFVLDNFHLIYHTNHSHSQVSNKSMDNINITRGILLVKNLTLFFVMENVTINKVNINYTQYWVIDLKIIVYKVEFIQNVEEPT